MTGSPLSCARAPFQMNAPAMPTSTTVTASQ